MKTKAVLSKLTKVGTRANFLPQEHFLLLSGHAIKQFQQGFAIIVGLSDVVDILSSPPLFGRTCHRLLWVTAPKGWLTYNFQNFREYELSGSANQFPDLMSKVGLFR